MLRRKKAEPKTQHFLSLDQDIVAWSQEAKVWIKVCNINFRENSRRVYILTLEVKSLVTMLTLL
jgi:hypothetical protein